MFNRQIKKIRIIFELFPRLNINRIQQECSKLKTSVEFHSLEIEVRVNCLILYTSNALCISSSYAERAQSRPQSKFVALPLLLDTRGRSAI